MGAKLAKPDKLCINVWGDAAIGFTGMDFETAVRERIPILSILLNNFCMAIELKVMPVSTERYRVDRHLGRLRGLRPRARRLRRAGRPSPARSSPAIRRGIAATERGQPALLEFITSQGGRGLQALNVIPAQAQEGQQAPRAGSCDDARARARCGRR